MILPKLSLSNLTRQIDINYSITWENGQMRENQIIDVLVEIIRLLKKIIGVKMYWKLQYLILIAYVIWRLLKWDVYTEYTMNILWVDNR